MGLRCHVNRDPLGMPLAPLGFYTILDQTVSLSIDLYDRDGENGSPDCHPLSIIKFLPLTGPVSPPLSVCTLVQDWFGGPRSGDHSPGGNRDVHNRLTSANPHLTTLRSFHIDEICRCENIMLPQSLASVFLPASLRRRNSAKIPTGAGSLLLSN